MKNPEANIGQTPWSNGRHISETEPWHNDMSRLLFLSPEQKTSITKQIREQNGHLTALVHPFFNMHDLPENMSLPQLVNIIASEGSIQDLETAALLERQLPPATMSTRTAPRIEATRFHDRYAAYFRNLLSLLHDKQDEILVLAEEARNIRSSVETIKALGHKNKLLTILTIPECAYIKCDDNPDDWGIIGEMYTPMNDYLLYSGLYPVRDAIKELGVTKLEVGWTGTCLQRRERH